MKPLLKTITFISCMFAAGFNFYELFWRNQWHDLGACHLVIVIYSIAVSFVPISL